jgi:GntR family transcriptional regulator
VLFKNRALYLQVRDALSQRIASGEWMPGFALPNEGDLAREVGVSSGTMRKALELMERRPSYRATPGAGQLCK